MAWNRNNLSTEYERPRMRNDAVDRGWNESYDNLMENIAPPQPPDKPPAYRDPVIDAYMKDVDRTMLRENLKKTVQERVDAFIDFMKAREECQRAGEKARESK